MRILLFGSRQLCYYSNGYFVDKMAAAMERCGYEVTICDLFSVPGEQEKERASVENARVQELLDDQIGQKYDAVIDFNSFLPRLENEEGIPYPDLIDAPFYNYIVDHPLYHHPALIKNLKNYHVICIDEDHGRYVRENYPQIRSVQVLPIGAEAVQTQSEKGGDKCQYLTFLGTHIPSSEIMKQIDLLPGRIRDELHTLIDLLRMDPDLPVDQGFLQLYPEYRELSHKKNTARAGNGEQELNFADCMNQRYLADKYLRCAEREQVVTALLKGGIPLHVYGNGWGDYLTERTKGERSIFTEMGTVDFETSVQKIAEAEILLNVQPRFTHGIHDRITAAMLNHTPCLSDGTTYLREHILDGREILYYDKNRPEEILRIARQMMGDPELRAGIAERGYEKAKREFSWDAWVEKFIIMR